MRSEKIKVSVIVFDQGNTLIMDPFRDILQLNKDSFGKICSEYGVHINTSTLIDKWIESNSSINYPYIGHFYQEEPIIQDALRQLGVKNEIVALLGLDLLKVYRSGFTALITNNERTLEVKSTLESLVKKGKRLGVFSNDRSVALGLVLSSVGIVDLFEYIETSEAIGIEKPDSRVFQHIIDHFSVPPHEIAYIGDDPLRDIEAAKKQGLIAIQYINNQIKYNESWRNYGVKSQIKQDATIEKLSELLDIIE